MPSDRNARRLAQLYVGLTLYGVSNSLMVLGGLGLDPWDTFHQGLSRTFGLGIGTWTCIVGAAVLLGWIPLPQRPGLGTASNVAVIGAVVDAMLAVCHAPHALGIRVALLVVGIVLNGIATGFYIGAGLGPGPRDGLTTGLVAARGTRSIRVVRTVIELGVLISGVLLGATIGIGTVAYALAIGPITHVTIPRLALASPGLTGADRLARARGPLLESLDV